MTREQTEKELRQMPEYVVYLAGDTHGRFDRILQGMRTLLADEAMPTAEQVRAFLQAPDGDTALDPQQQMVAMDQMLQCMEVNFRTCCDLLRYQQMKKASAVRDMDEFLDVLYPGNTEEEQDESV